MKTIQLSDELYEKLLTIAQGIATQDSRCTGKPYIFQVQTEKKVWGEYYEDNHVLINSEGDEIGPWNKETIETYCVDNDIPMPDWAEEFSTVGRPYSWDYETWLKAEELRLVSYNIFHEYQNAFFTETACKAHIERNKHNLDNPKDYLSYAHRNPEMETMFEFFDSLIIVDPPYNVSPAGQNLPSHEKA